MAARITQHGIEVLRTDTAPTARVSQSVVESLRHPTAFTVRTSQFAVEVLRTALPAATRFLPLNDPRRITNNGGGTRIQPL